MTYLQFFIDPRFDVALGVLYALFGRGPRIDGIPPALLFLARLLAPCVMIGLSLWQHGLGRLRELREAS